MSSPKESQTLFVQDEVQTNTSLWSMWPGFYLQKDEWAGTANSDLHYFLKWILESLRLEKILKIIELNLTLWSPPLNYVPKILLFEHLYSYRHTRNTEIKLLEYVDIYRALFSKATKMTNILQDK